MSTKTRVAWNQDMNFTGTDADGRTVKISAGSGEGVSPMQMLLIGLGGCSSADVVSILKKQRVELTDLVVDVNGERGEEYPRPYEKIHMHFVATGHNLDSSKVERAITLSTEKYCGVHATLRGVAQITWDYEIREASETE